MKADDALLARATPIERIRYLMARLREPEYGCPWDQKQTHRSIAPFTIEEAYEVADAIERNDIPHLREELGDLVFQVVFYAQMAEEAGEFTFDEVLAGLEAKLVRRHPHVFPAGTLESRITPGVAVSDEQIKGTWEAIKQQEKGPKRSSIDDIPASMAPLKRSQKLQKAAARIGFDWPSPREVMDKLEEETLELREAIEGGEQARIADEIGDMLFVLTNLARHYRLDAETLMLSVNQKFDRRFRHMEDWLATQGRVPGEASLDEMEEGWRDAKKAGK
jgi:ATP diphosphatase